MVITKTPFRVSFFGGGTDYPIWYEKNGGVVLSTTIDKYCYILIRYLPSFSDHKYRLRYTHREEVNNIDEIKHPKVRECLKFLNLDKGIEMVHTSDIPAMTGLASSSAFTVGFLNSISALQGTIVPKQKLALDALHIEQNVLKENIGSQDSVAAAFGGFNRIEFKKNNNISVHPITIKPSRLQKLQKNLMLFYIGSARSSSDIAAEQIKNTNLNYDKLKKMEDIVNVATKTLGNENNSLDDLGHLLHKSWLIKRELSSKITNPAIDKIYNTGLGAGAIGGKLLGAGGGGFMLFYVKPGSQSKLKNKLKGLVNTPFQFENFGSQVIYYNPQTKF